MPKFDKASEEASNLSLSAKLLEVVHEMGMTVSQTGDTLLVAKVRRHYWQQWSEENREAVSEYNARIASEGLPLAKYRTF